MEDHLIRILNLSVAQRIKSISVQDCRKRPFESAVSVLRAEKMVKQLIRYLA
jgi:hypothetical protein